MGTSSSAPEIEDKDFDNMQETCYVTNIEKIRINLNQIGSHKTQEIYKSITREIESYITFQSKKCCSLQTKSSV